MHGSGISRQLENTRSYCERKNLELKEDLRDVGLSGYKGHNVSRGQLGEFLDGIREGTIDRNVVLVVESLDRLSRQNPLQAFTQFVEILNYGIELHTLSDQQVYTKETVTQNQSLLFVSIGSMMRAHEESSIKSQRLESAWKRKREQTSEGKTLTRLVPGWISVDEHNKMHLIPEHAETVRSIFKMSIEENLGYLQITRHLNEKIDSFPKITPIWKTKNTSETWGSSFVVKILNTPNVYGAIETKHGLIENYYPPVISKAEFSLHQEKQRNRLSKKRGRKGIRQTNLFQGLIKCGCCGSNVKLAVKQPTGLNTLICIKKSESRTNCSMYNWNYAEFESSFLNFIDDLPIAEVFTNTNRQKQRLELQKELVTQNDRLKELKIELEIFFINMKKIDDSKIVTDMVKIATNTREEIDKVELTIIQLEQNVANFDTFKPVENQKEIRAKLKEPQSKEIRQRLSRLIDDLVDLIEIHSDDSLLVNPWEIEDNLPGDYIEWFNNTRTHQSKHKTIEEHLSTAHGKRSLLSFERYFIVTFKSGSIRYVNNKGQLVVKK
jgi:DNA invertase Pin-like site-specific DNA recombinase